jgi:hypothetical protein
VIAVVLRPVLVRPQCKPLLESGWAPSNPSDSKESRSLRTDTKRKLKWGLASMTTRERNILITLGLLLLVSVAYLAGRHAFPELWPWF